MTNPGLTRQATARTTLRVFGGLLLLLGALGLVAGAALFARGFLADDMDSMGKNAMVGIMLFGGGGFLAVFGLGAMSAGFLGAQSRYVAGETMPVAKDSAAFLTDGEGFLGIGRTVDDRPSE